MFQTEVVEKIKTHILSSVTFFPQNCAFYETMWKNIVEPGRSQMTVWYTHISCCIHKSANTHFEYVILIAFLLQQWLHKCTSVLSYMYTASLV